MPDQQTMEIQSEMSNNARRLVAYLSIAGGIIFFASYLAFLIYWSWKDGSWMISVVKNHFAAIVGAPCAAFASLIIVILLRYSIGPIEIKGLGFEFKGAAGPIVLWLFCFLAIVLGIKTLW